VTARPSSGSLQLAGALSWVDCTIETVYLGGDRNIAVGLVRDLDIADGEVDPLLFFLAGSAVPAHPYSVSTPPEAIGLPPHCMLGPHPLRCLRFNVLCRAAL
jgi:hypothetical protein